MKTHLLRSLLAVVSLAVHISAAAVDTDLFVGLPPNPGDLPNVLFIVDNTANWNTAFTNERAALRSVLNALPVNADNSARFRVGFMMFTETGGGNSGTDGGYVRAAVRDLNSVTKAKYVALLDSLDVLDDKSNSGKLGPAMADAYRYFTGLAPYSGNNKNKTDYTGNISGTAASNAVYVIPNTSPNKNALNSKAGAAYNSPLTAGSCAKNFIIYISNGAASDSTADIAGATAALTSAGGSATAIQISPSGSQDNVGDEWARFLKTSSMAVTTYTIDVDKKSTGQGPGWSALLRSMASVSSGEYFDVSSSVNSGAQITNALAKIFSQIQSVNSVFAAVSLPVSVNTQGTYRNQVYIGMFRPDATAAPRWAGNLKQYKLGFVNNVLKLQDADSSAAIDSGTGFIDVCARSFWTPATAGLAPFYWNYSGGPEGECLSKANSDVAEYPDGNVVKKGAQAYALRNMSSRPVKTCSSVFASCTALVDFNSTSATAALLGASTTDGDVERDALINWAKGLNPDNEGAKGLLAPRPSIHGDVVHSRPVAINFGTEDAPKVVVFYGSNDGILHAINGNRDNAPASTANNIGSATPGQELWAFIPPEFFPYIKRIRDNSIEISYPGTIAVSEPKRYGIDGPVSAYVDNTNAYIYATMRRGGRALYAFNVPIANPANFTLKWKKGCPNAANDTGCTTDATSGLNFNGIGQTWSAPKVLFSSNYNSTHGGATTPLLIMGGGYDNCEDADVNTCATTKGNRVYVMDANTGALLLEFETARGVVAEIFVVPDIDGTAKHAYAADLGGNIYRINIGAAAPDAWTITRIASLGCDTTASCASNRKFMFTPDVIDDNGTYTLLIGSGDREKPLNFYTATNAVANKFFMLKDKPLDPDWLSDELTDGVCGLALLCKNSLLEIDSGNPTTTTPTSLQLAEKKGWSLALRSHEQVVTLGITVFDNVTFSTHIPAQPVIGSCVSNLGTASVYNISYKDASSSRGGVTDRYQTISGGGLPPSPVAGNVTLDSGSTVPFCIGCNPNSALEGGNPITPPQAVQPKARVYWYIQK